MEILKNNNNELTLRYRLWAHRYEKLLVPIPLLGFSVLLYFSATNQLTYKWTSALIALWGLFSTFLIAEDFYKEDFWTFDVNKRSASHYSRRPGFCRLIPRVPLFFPALGILQVIDFGEITDVIVQEKVIYRKKWIRIALTKSNGREEFLVKDFRRANEDESHRLQKIVQAIKAKLRTGTRIAESIV
eukprot:TRINITY_DN12290_c0_g1_i1.p1 TRINITY_DN12290_c0_g1~~TRINITY_DN12290_c0_g1_i1.p1  ORF type:complete len:187 (-),score=19.78 TRINITY_DN12290_c0_g1_i1:40-600(-)